MMNAEMSMRNEAEMPERAPTPEAILRAPSEIRAPHDLPSVSAPVRRSFGEGRSSLLSFAASRLQPQASRRTFIVVWLCRVLCGLVWDKIKKAKNLMPAPSHRPPLPSHFSRQTRAGYRRSPWTSIWMLKLECSLVLGAWCLEFPPLGGRLPLPAH